MGRGKSAESIALMVATDPLWTVIRTFAESAAARGAPFENIAIDVSLATEGIDLRLAMLGAILLHADATHERDIARESLRKIGRKAFWSARA